MHGVSSPFIQRGMQVFGFPEQAVIEVAEQRVPDPEFPTVAFPNPEEKGEFIVSVPPQIQFTSHLLQGHLQVTPSLKLGFTIS